MNICVNGSMLVNRFVCGALTYRERIPFTNVQYCMCVIEYVTDG